MDCGKCGKEISETDAFCRACGAPTGPPVETVAATAEGIAPPAGPRPAESTKAEAPLAQAPPTPPAPAVPQPPPSTVKPRTSGWAVASLVMGILGWTCLFFIGSVLAIIFGAVARHEIKESGGALKGKGLAATGLTLGIILVVITVIGAAVFFPISLLSVGPTRTITRMVDQGKAVSVKARLDMLTGTMTVGGGASELMRGEFTYNVSAWRPAITYMVPLEGDRQGKLQVKQANAWNWAFWRTKNLWDIRFKDSVPLDLSATLHAGDGTFDVSSLDLASLKVDSNAGNVNADLAGDMSSLESVTTKLDAGNTTLDLSGTYSTPMTLDVTDHAGNIDVNMVGTWRAGLSGTIENSAGNITLRLPRDVGVIVTAKTSVGNVQSTGMKQGSGADTFTNDEYGKSAVTLRLNVHTSAGNIRLDLAD